MKSGGREGSLGTNDFVICLSDDENVENNVYEELATAADDTVRSSPAAPRGKLSITSHGDVAQFSASADQSIPASPSAPSRCDAVSISLRSSPGTTGQGVASPNLISLTSVRGGVSSPGITKPFSQEVAMGVRTRDGGEGGERVANDDEKDGPRQVSRRYNQARKRNTFIQTLLTTPGCVLVIDNLELDVQPIDMLEQLMKFSDSKEKIHSVHIPPPYPELNRAIGYAVFMNKECADAAAALLSRNFVVSARGRPWVVTRCVQELNEEDFGFPTISAFQGETQDGNGGSFGGLKIVTDKQEAEHNAAKRRRVVFEQHRRQAQLMFQRMEDRSSCIRRRSSIPLYVPTLRPLAGNLLARIFFVVL